MTIFGAPLFPIVLLLGGVIDLLLAMALKVFVVRLGNKADAIRRKWQPVPMKILSSTIVETQGEEGPLYEPRVRYEYTVDGTRREGDRVSLFPKWSSSDRERSRKVVLEFPRDRQCTGWVNPSNLDESVLNPEALPPPFVLLIFLILAGSGVLMIVGGVVVWIFRVGPSF
jgi:hypothetical protein